MKESWALARDFWRGSDYAAQRSSTYVRLGGAWKLALHQQTPLPGGKA